MKKIIILVIFVQATLGCMNKKNHKQAEYNDLKTLDDRVVALAQMQGKDPRSYRMHIRTDVDGAIIYRQVGSYVIVEAGGRIIYIPDRS